jgi:Uma2 family endonuclease
MSRRSRLRLERRDGCPKARTLNRSRRRDTVIGVMKTDASNVGAPQLWRIPRIQYERMVSAGAFGPDDRVELLDGVLIAHEPQGSRHATAVALTRAVLEKAFGPGYHVREEKPLALDPLSEPEPDLVVVRGTPRDYRDAHPSTPLLMVEVAESSLRFDRRGKGAVYARAGVSDYWVLNLVDDVLEVYREPVRSSSTPVGWKYRRVKLLRRGTNVSPLAAPRRRIRIVDLLP